MMSDGHDLSHHIRISTRDLIINLTEELPRSKETRVLEDAG
jgi:hypothetical protein